MHGPIYLRGGGVAAATGRAPRSGAVSAVTPSASWYWAFGPHLKVTATPCTLRAAIAHWINSASAKRDLRKLARESRFASASGNGTNGFCCSNQRGWSSKRSITPVVRPQMAALGQAALSVDSPDHSAAQVLAFMHGPEAESTENSAVATAKPKGAGGGTTSREDMPLATLQDNNERDSVVKIVWTAEEDQQLLQVRPEYSLPLWNGSIASCTHSHWHSVRNVPSRH